MLGTRVLTAVALLLGLVSVARWAPGPVFNLVLLLILAIAGTEWLRLLGRTALNAWGLSLGMLLLGAFGLFYSPAVMEAAQGHGGHLLPLYGLVSLVWVLLVPLLLKRSIGLGQNRWSAGLIALVLLFVAWLALIQAHGRGMGFLLSVLLIVWLSDTAAYFAGRRFGRHKLAPAISPGKTWEGVAGALCATLTLATVAVLMSADQAANAWAANNVFSLLHQAYGWILMLLLVSLLTMLGVIGDLYESLLKRVAGVKDSGRLLPGHGGVLDRIDALIPIFPVTMLVVSLAEVG